MKFYPYLVFFIFLASCNSIHFKQEDFAVAVENGNLANESYIRSLRCVKAWLNHRDTISGLIPSNLTGKEISGNPSMQQPIIMPLWC